MDKPRIPETPVLNRTPDSRQPSAETGIILTGTGRSRGAMTQDGQRVPLLGARLPTRFVAPGEMPHSGLTHPPVGRPACPVPCRRSASSPAGGG